MSWLLPYARDVGDGSPRAEVAPHPVPVRYQAFAYYATRAITRQDVEEAGGAAGAITTLIRKMRDDFSACMVVAPPVHEWLDTGEIVFKSMFEQDVSLLVLRARGYFDIPMSASVLLLPEGYYVSEGT